MVLRKIIKKPAEIHHQTRLLKHLVSSDFVHAHSKHQQPLRTICDILLLRNSTLLTADIIL
jgi:hypothetical protein